MRFFYRRFLFLCLIICLAGCSNSRLEPENVYCNGVLCDDSSNCLAGHCDPVTNECIKVADNSRCLAGEYCDAELEKCLPTGCIEDIHCSDGVDCTNDRCILNPINGQVGTCQNFPDDNLCSGLNQHCDPVEGCVVHTCQLDADCVNPQNLCSVGICDNLVCRWTQTNCSHLDDQCNDGMCVPATGMCTEINKPAATSCDDLDGCTVADYCLAGVCQGTPKDCSEFDDQCHIGFCKPDSGNCEARPAHEGDSCDDEDSCTVGTTCHDDGSCGGGSIRDQDDDGFGDGLCGGNDCNDLDSTIYPENVEICDGKDNNCDLSTDEDSQGNVHEICACLHPCGLVDCSLVGNCFDIPGIGVFCAEVCDLAATDSSPCGIDNSGTPRNCVSEPTNEFQFCACVPECPQSCGNDQECYPFGLYDCLGETCTRQCLADSDCPYPYICGPGSQCVCENSPSDNCLFCEEEQDCISVVGETVPCENNTCEVPCTNADECPNPTDFYCGHNQLCSCLPPADGCLWCQDSEDCSKYGMFCEPFSDVGVIGATAQACSTACFLDEHCPAGWFCWGNEDGMKQGWCIQRGCLCNQIGCDPGVEPSPCEALGLECLTDEHGISSCSRQCGGVYQDCPIGYYCYSASGDGEGFCRCDPHISGK
jgi:putative metal-binding protein